MAITLGATGADHASAGTSHAFAYPTGIAANSLLVLVAIAKDEVVSLPAGWTAGVAPGASPSPCGMIAVKLATGSESGTLAVTTGDTDVHGNIFRLEGHDTTTPLDVAGTTVTGTGTSVAVPTLTVTTTGVWLVIFNGGGETTRTSTGPGTEQKEYTTNPVGAIYTEELASSGATG